MHTAILLIGCNIGKREENLAHAISLIGEKTGVIQLCSSVYEAEPWGFESEHNFLNQCLTIRTTLIPSELLFQLQAIETGMGRERRTEKYTDRIIDIDILFYDDLVLSSEELTIPHPRIEERKFTLIPLLEILPGLVHPVSDKPIKEILLSCRDPLSVRKMEPGI